MIDWARWYTEAGMTVVPTCRALSATNCTPHGRCPKPGKVPLVRWKGLAENTGQGQAEKLLQIDEWWGTWPEANIAAITGVRSGLVVVDVEYEGLGELAKHEVPRTPTLRSQSGGRHLWFRYFVGAKTCAWIEGSLYVGDIRADMALATIPPSVGAYGSYLWETPPTQAPIVSAPPWVHAIIARNEERRRYRLQGPLQHPPQHEPLSPPPLWLGQLSSELQTRALYDYHLMDRSRVDAALTIELVKRGADDASIAEVLLYPRRSKARERARTGGWQAAESYIAGTIGWARRKVETKAIHGEEPPSHRAGP